MNEHPVDFSFLPPGSVDWIEQNAKKKNPNIRRSEVMLALHQSYRKFNALSRYDPTSLRPNVMIQPTMDQTTIDNIISGAIDITSKPKVYRSLSNQSVANSTRPQFYDSHDHKTFASNRENKLNRMNIYIHPQ